MTNISINAEEFWDFKLALSDREISNDVRSQTDITEEVEMTGDGTPEEHARDALRQPGGWFPPFEPYEQREFRFGDTWPLFLPEGRTHITWLGAEGEFLPGHVGGMRGLTENECYEKGGRSWYPADEWGESSCYFDRVSMRMDIIERGDDYVVVRAYNPTDMEGIARDMTVHYQYLAQEAIAPLQWIEAQRRTLTVRAVNEQSIRKYGRRVMDLVWPLGQTTEAMQALVDNYCARHCEPVCWARGILKGITSTQLMHALDRRINDRVEIDIPKMEMNEVFFIIKQGIEHRFSRPVEGIFDFEQARDIEKVTLATLDEAELDGDYVLAP